MPKATPTHRKEFRAVAVAGAHRCVSSVTSIASELAAPGLWPGLVLTALIAGLALAIRLVPGVTMLSPMILAIMIATAFHNSVGTPAIAKSGVVFAQRRILRFAIMLLGLQLTAAQIIEVGPQGVGILVVALLATYGFTMWLGPRIGVEPKLTQLIAAGTSICGASAVIAMNTVTRARDEDVAYAVASVTIFGSIAMFVYPLLPTVLALEPRAFGLWAGASIHEIAQVVAASFQNGQLSGEFGTVAKLSRVLMLAPLIVGLGFLASRDKQVTDTQSVPMPWFLLGFLALVCVNSVVTISPATKSIIVSLTAFLLTMALAALGLETDLAKLRAKGFKPMLLGACASVFIAGLSLALIKLAP